MKSLKSNLEQITSKSSQGISKLQTDHEDLKKLLERLNLKLQKVDEDLKGLKDNFEDPDKEREDELDEMDAKVDFCKESTNSLDDGQKSLIARVQQIAQMVQGILRKYEQCSCVSEEVTEDEINKRIGINHEILRECEKIDGMVRNAFELGH